MLIFLFIDSHPLSLILTARNKMPTCYQIINSLNIYQFHLNSNYFNILMKRRLSQTKRAAGTQRESSQAAASPSQAKMQLSFEERLQQIQKKRISNIQRRPTLQLFSSLDDEFAAKLARKATSRNSARVLNPDLQLSTNFGLEEMDQAGSSNQSKNIQEDHKQPPSAGIGVFGFPDTARSSITGLKNQKSKRLFAIGNTKGQAQFDFQIDQWKESYTTIPQRVSDAMIAYCDNENLVNLVTKRSSPADQRPQASPTQTKASSVVQSMQQYQMPTQKLSRRHEVIMKQYLDKSLKSRNSSQRSFKSAKQNSDHDDNRSTKNDPNALKINKRPPNSSNKDDQNAQKYPEVKKVKIFEDFGDEDDDDSDDDLSRASSPPPIPSNEIPKPVEQSTIEKPEYLKQSKGKQPALPKTAKSVTSDQLITRNRGKSAMSTSRSQQRITDLNQRIQKSDYLNQKSNRRGEQINAMEAVGSRAQPQLSLVVPKTKRPEKLNNSKNTQDQSKSESQEQRGQEEKENGNELKRDENKEQESPTEQQKTNYGAGLQFLESMRPTRNSTEFREGALKVNQKNSKEFFDTQIETKTGEHSSRALTSKGNPYGLNGREIQAQASSSYNTINRAKSIGSSSPLFYELSPSQNARSLRKLWLPESSRQESDTSKKSLNLQSLGTQLSSRISKNVPATGSNQNMAKMRSTLFTGSYDQTQFLNVYPKQVKPNENSEKIVLKRFNKEFTKILGEIVNSTNGDPQEQVQPASHDKLPMCIKQDAFRALIDQLVFFKDSQSQSEGNKMRSSPPLDTDLQQQATTQTAQQQQGSVPSNEDRIIKEMWTFLTQCRHLERLRKRQKQEAQDRARGDQMELQEALNDQSKRQEASVGDIKVVLMAIFSIKGNKRMGISPMQSYQLNQDIESEYHQTSMPMQTGLPFGWINDQHQLCLTENDVLKIQSKFGPLNAMRKFIQGKKQAEKKKNSSKAEAQKYCFKPVKVEEPVKCTPQKPVGKASSSALSSAAKTTRNTHDICLSQDRQSTLIESPITNIYFEKDKLLRGQSLSASLRTLRDSQTNLNQKMRDKLFKSGTKQQRAVVQKTPGPPSKDESNGRSGPIKKTQITLSSQERKNKGELSSKGSRGKSPARNVYLVLDKDFRSYNTQSQQKLHRQPSNLIDRLCQSYNKGEQRKALNVGEGSLKRIAPPTESNESSSKKANENVDQDIAKQGNGESSAVLDQLAQPLDIRRGKTDSGDGGPLDEDREELKLRRPRPSAPSNRDQTCETPSVRENVPCPVEQTENIVPGAELAEPKEEQLTFQDENQPNQEVPIDETPQVDENEKLNKQQAQSSFKFQESIVSKKSLKKSFKKKQEAQEPANVVYQMDSEASDHDAVQLSKEIEVYVEKPEEKQRSFKDEQRAEISKHQPLPKDDSPNLYTTPLHEEDDAGGAALLSHPSTSSIPQSQHAYKFDELKTHTIILKKKAADPDSSIRSTNRSPLGEHGNLKSIIQRSLLSLKNQSQKPTTPGSSSPGAKMSQTHKGKGEKQESQRSQSKKREKKRPVKVQQEAPQAKEAPKKTVTIFIQPTLKPSPTTGDYAQPIMAPPAAIPSPPLPLSSPAPASHSRSPDACHRSTAKLPPRTPSRSRDDRQRHQQQAPPQKPGKKVISTSKRRKKQQEV